MGKAGREYAARINVCDNGFAYVSFGEKAPKLMKDEGGYYSVEPSDTDKTILCIKRYSYKRNRNDGRAGIFNGQVRFAKTEVVDKLRAYIGEYSVIDMTRESDNGSTTYYTLSTANRSNFTNMYAKRTGKTQDKDPGHYIADKKKIEELYNKVPEAAKVPVPIVEETNPLTTIDEIMGEQLKELESKIKKLQAELDPLVEARLRLTRARECLKYNCELQKGDA